ncbi:MAG: lactonase family protein [Flavobacterium sp.]|uniref:lactonase family protein n=1 Tax=Flavobacterium sp. TaxID=239 RepID=UPI003263074F
MIKYAALFTAIFCITTQAQQNHHNLIIGTYTNTCQSDGMYAYDFDTETADAQLKGSSKNIVNPSFLSFSADKKFVYSTNENGNDSQVSAFHFYSDSGNLQFLNSKSSEGNDPCYVLNDDKNVLVANYSGGNITVFGKNEDGTIGKHKQIVMHMVQSVGQDSLETSHMHMLQFSSDKKYLLASDLGKDYLYVYRYDPDAKSAVLDFSYFLRVNKGSGPRHFTFSPDGQLVYLLNELDGSLLVLSFINGELKLLQETTVVDKKFKGKTAAADIHITADGKFLYATNRGDANTISCFEIKKNGKLKFVQNTSTLGKGPRNFTIDPTGNFLLIAHQYTNEVVIFSIDKTTGTLTDTGKRIALCSPVCLVFE